MFGNYAAPIVAVVAALVVAEVQAGPIPQFSKDGGLAARNNHHDNGSSCWARGRRGHWQDDICLDLDLDLNVDVHKRSPSGPHKFTNYYADRTPCWVDGRRGWMKDHTCGDLIDIEASVKVGKRFHNFDDPYFANGTPCFHDGRQGLLRDLLCAVIDVDVDVDAARYDHGYAGPWRFNRFYDNGRRCWVDSRRGYIQDQTCGNLIDIDADLSIGRRYYKDDPYFLNGVPCLENGNEGVLTNYQCIAAEVHVQKRGYWGYYYQGENGLIDGAPCWQDGRQGVVGGLLCVVADVNIGKRRLLGPPDGDSCYRFGRWGSMRNGDCELLDVDADVIVKRGILGSGQGDILGNIVSSGPGLNGELLGDVLGVTGGDHGYSHGRQYPHGHEFGHYYEDDLVDAAADIDVDNLTKRGYYDPDELMAEIEAAAEVNADGINYGKRYYRQDGADLDINADIDVNVDDVHHGHRYHQRSGLLTNKNGVKGAVDTLGKTTHNTLGKRDLGHGYEHHHEYDHGLDIDAKANVDIDAGHRASRYIRSLISGAQGNNMQPRPNGFGKAGRVKGLVSDLGKIIH